MFVNKNIIHLDCKKYWGIFIVLEHQNADVKLSNSAKLRNLD